MTCTASRHVVVVVFNAADHAGRLEELTRELPVRIRHVTFQLPWDEIAARRAGIAEGSAAVPMEVKSALPDAEVILGFGLPLRLTTLAPRLRWVETPATGFDQLTGTGVLESDIAVTTVGGLFAPWVAEHVFALLFAMWRRLGDYRDAQGRREWMGREKGGVRALRDATMAIVGLGNIGQAVARIARTFGMRVFGTRRGTQRPEHVDRLFPRQQLHAMLADADVVVLAVAGTPETVNLIGAAELAAMQAHACLINVSRGIVLDEAALAQALHQGRLAGAALDVFVREPLPADSPLWGAPNLVITPHIAVDVPAKLRRCVEHFAENLQRYCAGQALCDRVQR